LELTKNLLDMPKRQGQEPPPDLPATKSLLRGGKGSNPRTEKQKKKKRLLRERQEISKQKIRTIGTEELNWGGGRSQVTLADDKSRRVGKQSRDSLD